MGTWEVARGNQSPAVASNTSSEKIDGTSQFELRQRWEVGEAARVFNALFHKSLLSYVIRIAKIFSPPQSIGFLFEFAPGMRDEFKTLVSGMTSPMLPDDPGMGHVQKWYRSMASGAAIGASFREKGKETSLHIAFNETLCDVHVDRNGFEIDDGDGMAHWDLNGLLRHATIDLLGDKKPGLLLSFTHIDDKNRPTFHATLGPWLAIELPSPGHEYTEAKVGVVLSGWFNLPW